MARSLNRKKEGIKMAKKAFKVGQLVKFLGYSEDVAEAEQVLTEGENYTIVEVNPEEEMVAFEVENPDFNPKKKVSEDNAKTVVVEVFFDEVGDADDDEEEEEEEKPAKKVAAKKAPAKKAKQEEEEDDEDEGDEEEEAPAPKKTAAKKAPAKKVAKVEEDDEEEEEAPAPKKAPAKKTAAKATAKKAPAKAATKGKAPAKEEKAEESDELAPLENEDEDIVALVEGSENILELASELVEEGAELDYRLGGVLYHVRLSKEFQSLDDRYKENGGFGLYVKEHLNIEYRKAMYLIDIYYKFNMYGIAADKVKEIGWTKAAKIAAVMTDDNAEDLVELAEQNTVADLQDTIKEQYVAGKGAGTEKKKRVTFKFRLFEENATVVTEILEEAAQTLGTKDLAAVFEHIVTEWGAEYLNTKPKKSAKAPAKTAAKAGTKAKKQVEEETEEE